MDIEFFPIFLGGVMVFSGNQAPSADPAQKQIIEYLIVDGPRLSDRFGVDIRSPPGHPMQTTSLNKIRFLRVVKAEKSPEILEECIRLLFLEFYSSQTDYRREEFWDCLVPTLSREEVARLRKVSQTEVHKEGVKSDVAHVVTTYGMFGAPWMVVQRPSDGAEDVFFGTDKLDSIAWWLGPEYKWNGPYPDGSNPFPISTPSRQSQNARL